MSVSQYGVGVVVAVWIAATTAVGAVSLRRLVVPAWDGALARLAELVVGAAVLATVVELLGSMGALQRWTVVVASALAAVGAWVLVRRRGAVTTSRRHGPRRPDWPTGVVLAATAPFVLAPWIRQTADAVRLGMLEYDTLWYHLPFAARFVQDGWVIRPHHVGNPPDAFLPATSELFHAVGMLAFATDVLSPFLNLGWAAVFVLAAWCIGRPLGAESATTAAAAVVLVLPVIVASQAGSAQSDIAGLALLTAGLAFVVAEPNSARVGGLAGISTGLSIGTKLTFVAPGLALALGAVVLARPGRRRPVGLAWAVGLLATGAFWYVRNLAYTGTPLPWFGVHVAGIDVPSTGPTIDCGTTSLADLLADPGELRTDVAPFVPSALGPAWPLVLGVAAAGIVAAVSTRRRLPALLGTVAALSAAAYAVTPATAGGAAARCFAYNTRFGAAALALALFSLALALAPLGRRYVLAGAVVLGGVAVVTSKPTLNTSFLTAVVVVAVLAFAVVARPRLNAQRGILAWAGALLVGVLLIAGWQLQRFYLQHRYAGPRLLAPLAGALEPLRGVHDSRIAVVALDTHYPLYGPDLANRVEFPATRHLAEIEEPRTCEAWLAALARGRYDYVVIAPRDAGAREKITWMRTQPWAVEELHTSEVAVFRLRPGSPGRARCEPVRRR